MRILEKLAPYLPAYRRFRWILPALLLPLAIYLLGWVAEVDEYGQYSRPLGNVMVHFLRFGIVTTAVLVAVGFAKNFKDLLVNLILVSVPMVILSYPYGWAVAYFNPAKWSAFFGHSPFGLLFYPILYAGRSLIIAPIIGIIAGAVAQWGFKKKGNLFPLLNQIAMELTFWFLTIYIIIDCIVAFV